MNPTLRTCLAALSLSILALPVFAQQLTPLTTFGVNGNGTILPGERAYLTADGTRLQRGMAFNPTTGHLLIVNRSPIGAETINIIDAATGADVGLLDTCCPAFGGSASFLYNLIGIADDGAIYVGNLTTAAGLVEFNLYRWDSETNSQTLVYTGDPRNGSTAAGGTRWGDTLTVRGSGVNTEVLIATQSGTLAAVLKPADATMAAFTATTLAVNVPGGGIGYALAFGTGNTFYGKGASGEGNPLYRLSYDLGAGTATPLQTYGLDQFPGRVGVMAVHPASNLLATIEMTAGTNTDLVRLHDVSIPANPPAFRDREVVEVFTNANSIFSGAVAFGWTNVYALNSDNGIAAFTIAPGAPALAPAVFQNPQSRISQITSNVSFTVGADGTLPLAYQWYFNETNLLADATNASLSLTNVSTGNGGVYSVVITNTSGSITSGVAVLTVLPNFGNLLVYDPFAYTVDTALPGQGEWTMTSAAANGVVEAGNLEIAGLAPAVGNRYTWTANSSVRKPFGQYSAGEVYCSFAFRLDTASTSTANETFAGFSFGTSTTFPLKFNIIGDGAGGYQLGIYKGGGTGANGLIDTNHTYTNGQTIFVVGRYTFRDGAANDICDMWVNPDPATFGAGTAPAPNLAGAGDGAAEATWTFIDRFFWRWASAGYTKRVSDELRVGFSWAEVTPPNRPAVALSVTRQGANLIISWPAGGSSGYSLYSNLNVADAGGWEPISETVVEQAGVNTVTINPTLAKRYFRLQKAP